MKHYIKCFDVIIDITYIKRGVLIMNIITPSFHVFDTFAYFLSCNLRISDSFKEKQIADPSLLARNIKYKKNVCTQLFRK